jgi:hypothetical protein
MPRDCKVIQEDLTRFSGDVDQLERGGQNHLEHCPECSNVAREEKELGQLLSQAIPPADESLQSLIITSLRRLQARRRTLALVPIAASFMVFLAGISLLGSIPGSSLAAQFPRWTSSSWMSLAGAFTDWQIALSLAAASLSEAIPFTAVIFAAFCAAGGLVTSLALLHKWNKRISWQPSKE